MSDTEIKIYEYIASHPGAQTSDVSAACQLTQGELRPILKKLCEDGKLEYVRKGHFFKWSKKNERRKKPTGESSGEMQLPVSL